MTQKNGCTTHATHDSRCVFCILHGLATLDVAQRAERWGTADDFAERLEDDLASPCPCGSGLASLLCKEC